MLRWGRPAERHRRGAASLHRTLIPLSRNSGSASPAARPGVGLFLAQAGFLAGVLSGLVGVGGGLVMVPAMVSRRVGLTMSQASGNSLAAILPIAVVGTLTYSASRDVDTVAVLSVIPGSIVGAIAGARLTRRLPERVLALTFAALSVAAAARLAIPFGLPTAGAAVSASTGHVIGLLALGLVAGVASGLLGIGGGVIIVPVLVIAFGLSQQLAQGTSLAAIVPTGLSGAVTHNRLGHLNRQVVVALSVGGALGAVGGGLGATHIPQLPLRLIFAAYIAISGLYIGLRSPVAPGGGDPLP